MRGNFSRKVKRQLLQKALSVGSGKECPICGWTGYCFLPFGNQGKRRFDAKCPQCGSIERTRLAFLVANKEMTIESCDTLHVAPEKCIGTWLENKSKSYVSIDLYAPAMERMDLRNMTFGDGRFSLIWCSNVLEHIVEDDAAIREIFRVSRPGGNVVIQVPIWREKTFEDNLIISDKERLKHFYQTDHVRLYGIDIVERFNSYGFVARIHRAQDFGPVSVTKHSLSFISTNEVFIFQKPS